MAFVDDATLLAKKIFVTIIIYLVPVTIIVGGLLLTEKLLSQPSRKIPSVSTTSNPK